MIDRKPLDWRVPAAEWEKFRQHVESEFGRVEGYLGREAELAMREYADADRFEPVEKQVDRLVQAAGRTPSELGFKEKTSDLDASETSRVQVRVDPQIKDEFKRAAEDGENALA
ncbi:hypothetical protein ACFFQF_00805 [Haladaptatus pallidirubidus]|uniref:hypothetical protein n=1 Tax=Haladaptatus pallidirubidus TaxID=1008152 RepID=UPI0035E8F6D7